MIALIHGNIRKSCKRSFLSSSITIIVEAAAKERVGRFDSENISVTIDLRRRMKITPNLVELEQEYTDNMMLEYNNRFILNLAKNEDIMYLG